VDLGDFRAFARRLPAPEIGAVAAGEPLGDPATFRFPTSRWRHYERCDSLPTGLVVIGDAVCSFDPTFGQGMSAAALEAEVLQREIAAGREGVERRVAAGVAGVASIPWTLATGTARRLPGMPPKPLAERVLDRYLSRLVRVATDDEAVATAFMRVVNLVAKPPSLLAPPVAARVLLHRSEGRGLGAPGPVVPVALPPAARADLPSRDERLAG